MSTLLILNLKGYESNEASFFRHGGNYHDTIITDKKMKLFLEQTKPFFEILTQNYISKLEKFKQNKI